MYGYYRENLHVNHFWELKVVEAISCIRKKYCKSASHYKVQFASCSCANVDRNERKQLRKCETIDIVTKEDLLNKKQTYTKEWILLKNKIC